MPRALEVRGAAVAFCPICGEPRLRWLDGTGVHLCTACDSAFEPIVASTGRLA